MNVHVSVLTAPKHDANYEPAEGPDGDERRRAAARQRTQTPQRTQKDPQETAFPEAGFPNLHSHKHSDETHLTLHEWNIHVIAENQHENQTVQKSCLWKI